MVTRNSEFIRKTAIAERVPLSPYRALLNSLIMAAFAGWSLAVPHLELPLRYAALPFISGLLLSLPLALAGIRQMTEDGIHLVLVLAVLLDLASFFALAMLGYLIYQQTGGIPEL